VLAAHDDYQRLGNLHVHAIARLEQGSALLLGYEGGGIMSQKFIPSLLDEMKIAGTWVPPNPPLAIAEVKNPILGDVARDYAGALHVWTGISWYPPLENE
jgi:hypothetical protein